MSIRSLNFDILPTCDSHRYPVVTHLSNFRYSKTKRVKNRTPHGSKLTLSQNSLTPIQPNEDPQQTRTSTILVPSLLGYYDEATCTKAVATNKDEFFEGREILSEMFQIFVNDRHAFQVDFFRAKDRQRPRQRPTARSGPPILAA